jgi:hypothetical protein
MVGVHSSRASLKRSPTNRQFKVGDKIRVNLHHGKIEDAFERAVIQHAEGTKLQMDVVGLIRGWLGVA